MTLLLYNALNKKIFKKYEEKSSKLSFTFSRRSNDKTPLHIAVEHYNAGAVEVLIDERADLNARDKDNRTPLHLAILCRFCQDIMETLVEKGADVNAKNKDGKTPLHLAAQGGKIDTVNTLINKGANINVKDNNGQTPLWYANGNVKEILIAARLCEPKF